MENTNETIVPWKSNLCHLHCHLCLVTSNQSETNVGRPALEASEGSRLCFGQERSKKNSVETTPQSVETMSQDMFHGGCKPYKKGMRLSQQKHSSRYTMVHMISVCTCLACASPVVGQILLKWGMVILPLTRTPHKSLPPEPKHKTRAGAKTGVASRSDIEHARVFRAMCG